MEAKYTRKKILLKLNDEDIPKLKTWYDANIFTGISDFYIIVSDKNPHKLLCDSDYHLWYTYEHVHWILPGEEYPEDVIKLSIDEYIDVISPIDYYANNTYQIKKIKYE